MGAEQEKLTMSQRIDAFYRQSGGPGNPDIARILNEHLIHGKDHGVPGKKEDIQDAFTEVFLGDRSTQPIVLGLMKIRNSIKQEWERYLETQQGYSNQAIDELKREQIK